MIKPVFSGNASLGNPKFQKNAVNSASRSLPKPKNPPAATRERIPLSTAAGRILAEPVLSAIDLPAFDNSAVDGYAVRAIDIGSSRPERPARLSVCGRVPAGEAFAGTMPMGSCVRLFTGSPLPDGADAVVMQEDTRPDPGQPDVIQVAEPVGLGANVRRQGSDVRRGAAVAGSSPLFPRPRSIAGPHPQTPFLS